MAMIALRGSAGRRDSMPRAVPEMVRVCCFASNFVLRPVSAFLMDDSFTSAAFDGAEAATNGGHGSGGRLKRNVKKASLN